MFHNDASNPFQEFDFKSRYLIGHHDRMQKSRYGQGHITYPSLF